MRIKKGNKIIIMGCFASATPIAVLRQLCCIVGYDKEPNRATTDRHRTRERSSHLHAMLLLVCGQSRVES